MNWFANSLQIFEIIGTLAFALAGAMVAVEKHTDLFGVIFLGITTAMGGGIIRDILMGYFPAHFFTNYRCLIISTTASLFIFLFARIGKKYYHNNKTHVEQVNQIFDAIGLGAFAVSGTQMGIDAGFGNNVIFVIFLGMTTAIGGGVLRDLFLGEIPFVLVKHIYAIASIAGALLCYIIYILGQSLLLGMALGLITTFILRMCAIYFKWNLPKAF